MRHLGSLALGLVSAPIFWVLTGIGWVKFNTGLSRQVTADVALGFVVLLVAAVLFAVLLLPRWSPVGPAVVGGLFLIAALWAMIDIGSISDLTSADLFGVQFALSVPVGAPSILFGVPLLATVALPHRWRGAAARAPQPGGPGQPGYPPGPGGQYQPGAQYQPGPQYPPGGQVPPGGQYPPGGQFPPGGPAGHPPNYGPAVNPSHSTSAPPNYGPSGPTNFGPPAAPQNVPSGPPYYGPPPGQGRAPGAPPPGSPISGPPVPGPPPGSAPPAPPTFSPLTPPSPRKTDETTQFTGGGTPDDDGTDEATRRLGR